MDARVAVDGGAPDRHGRRARGGGRRAHDVPGCGGERRRSRSADLPRRPARRGRSPARGRLCAAARRARGTPRSPPSSALGAAGMSTSVDPSSAALLSGGLRQLGKGVGLLVPNASRGAGAFTGLEAPVAAARVLAESFPEVVVTLGEEGALWTDGSEVVRVAAEPAEVVDTTGAGDAFAAGLPRRTPCAALDPGGGAGARAARSPPGRSPPRARDRQRPDLTTV